MPGPNRRLLLPLLLVLLPVGCGSSQSTPTPAPTAPGPPVAPSSPVVNMAGTWTGTVTSANFPSRTITLVVSQGDSCVDGEWHDATLDWKGAISGFAAADSFSGQLSFERTAAGGGKCQAAGFVSGPVGDVMKLAAGDLSAPAGSCTGDLPQSLVISVRRQ
jgi:hypothetical protein